MSRKKLNFKTVAEIAATLEINERYLWRLANNVDRYYRSWEEPKKNSDGVRKITSPSRELKILQKKLNAAIAQRCDLGLYSHYGRKKKSNITNAIVHKGSPTIFTCDLRNFFPSVRPERIKKSLIDEQGCSPDVANLITKLVSFEFQLPQGAPTSTIIANIVTTRLQRRLGALAVRFNLTFSILGDDLTFSGNKIPEAFVHMVRKIIFEEGFKIHRSKGGVFNKSQSQIITGINIAHGISVGKMKRIWRAEHHNDHTRFKTGDIDEEEFERSKIRYAGRMAYAKSVEKSSRGSRG